MARIPEESGLGARAFSAGLTMAVAVALFAYGGYLLDGWLATEPLFLVVGALLGMLGGTVHLLQALAPEVLPFGKRKPSRKPPEARQTPNAEDRRSPPAPPDRSADPHEPPT